MLGKDYDHKTAAENKKKQSANNNTEQILCTIFFEDEDGYCEERAYRIVREASIRNSKVCISEEVKIPSGCEKIRIDPCEGYFCVVEKIEAVSHGSVLQVNPVNGMQIGNCIIFLTGDPQLEVLSPKISGSVIRIEIEYRVYSCQDTLLSCINSLIARCEHAENELNIISNAEFWKITKPARVCIDTIKRGIRKKHNSRNHPSKKSDRGNLLTKKEYKAQKSTAFQRDIKFSILVPLFNTQAKFLKEMIDSVRKQTYSNWELCLADGSDSEHRYVERICKNKSLLDRRIKYLRLGNNLGISGNSNACIEMATGDYYALLDHDDQLHPSALHEIMKAICGKDADFIYTDETKFKTKVAETYDPEYKPDYAPDTLRSYNYICHLTAFSKALLKKIGGGGGIS